MEEARFEEAQAAYDAGDFRAAAKGFLAVAGRGGDDAARAYHMLGNSLMRLRRFQDAANVYANALGDESYEKRGCVAANQGIAYASLGEYAKAIEAYQAALDDPGYETPYKALQGMAAAYRETGRIEDAASAYRRAALDESNVDPGKSLVNLGLCFMALGRPADAVEAYKAALGFEQYAGRGLALANLGQALSSLGEHAEAVKAFDKARELHGHTLTPAAQQAFEESRAAMAPARETIEGWSTGEMPPIIEGAQEVLSQAFEPALEDRASVISQPAPAPETMFGDDEAVDAFFSMTEEEMRARDREARSRERANRKRETSPWKAIVGWSLAVVILIGGLAGAYYIGLGWPTQQATVSGLIEARGAGESIEGYWVAVPDRDIEREMAKIPPAREFVIDDVSGGARVSVVRMTVTPEQGAPLRYEITLAREGVGWKVSGIENDWRSTGDS